jgi:hypothetical protein
LELLGLIHRKFLINLKCPFMHGEWQLFSHTLLVEVEGSLLIMLAALYALANVWRRGEMEKHARTRSPRLVRWGVVWCVNSQPKSGPKPRMSVAYFCRLFLL